MRTPQPNDMLPGPDNLEMFERSYLKAARKWFNPDVILLTAPDGVKFVMKDWSNRPLVFKHTWCRVAAAREIKVYEKLRGMRGVPQLICTLGQYGFIMEWLDARPLPRTKMRDLLGLRFFESLTDLVEQMHARGVAHGDLRRRNILRGLDGEPRLIDFETAVHANGSDDGGRVFKTVANVDHITIIKIRARYFPESLTDEEKRMLSDIPATLAVGRYLRQKVYAPLTRKGRKRIRRRADRPN